MNVNDVKKTDIPEYKPSTALSVIFARQEELMKKYHKIEKDNGLIITEKVPVSLHDSKGQFRLKDFAWRITEEIGEALEVYEFGMNGGFSEDGAITHFHEEIMDGFHFLVEFTILAGYSAADISSYYGVNLNIYELWDLVLKRSYDVYNNENLSPQSRSAFYPPTMKMQPAGIYLAVTRFIQSLGTTCNCLKNKPWKTSQMMTDTQYFYQKLRECWLDFLLICYLSGMQPEGIYELYFRKSEVNKFRQRSNY